MIDTVGNVRRRIIKKTLIWLLWAANLATIIYFWLPDGGPEALSGDTLTVLHSVGRLFGLLATFCVLVQFMLMGRVGWIEPVFGLDRLARFHRINGEAAIIFITMHIPLMIITHPLLAGSNNFLAVFDLPYVLWAAIGAAILYTTVGTTMYVIRKHLRFEWWYGIHFFNYAAIALIFWHQLANGGDLLGSKLFASYWIGLYIFVGLNVLLWRFSKTAYLWLKYDFKVQKIVPETATATSVYIVGKGMERFKAKAGQFILVRFFDRRFFVQEHPFSLSRMPSGEGLRLTIRQLGDFTNMVPQLKPGTPMWISGPFGSFTHEQQRTQKILYIAGGVGITPIRAMVEDQANRGEISNAVLLYGNRTEADTIFLRELTALAKKIAMPMHNVLSEQKKYKGEKGYIDQEKIARLVPDVATRDIFLCGPPPMMWGIIDQLKALGVPGRQIHYERFALHKKG